MGHSAEIVRHGDVAWRARLYRLSRDFAGVRRNIKRRLGILAPLRIAMYGGYGTSREVLLRGRVLEARQGVEPSLEDGRLLNFKRSFWQFESDEVANVELAVDLLGASEPPLHVISDDFGYFTLRHRLERPAQPGWLSARASVTAAPYPVSELPSAEGRVLIPSPDAHFGVISDIDDTILQSYVRNRLRLVYLTLVGNPLTRSSFEGTTELYRGLREGGRGAPFFYVSKSMWNLFPLLDGFIAHQRLPRGPLLLRQVGLFAPRPNVPHKAAAIRELLETYPRLPFLLIGDSGEHDLSIYLEAARQHPGRVPAILIRNVSPAHAREALEQQAQQGAPPDCRVLVFDDTQQAIELCAELGFWRPAPPRTVPPPRAVS